MPKKIKIEEGLEHLEEILEKMEKPDTALSESFDLYEEGMKLLKAVYREIDTFEKKVMMLSDDGKLEELPPVTEDE